MTFAEFVDRVCEVYEGNERDFGPFRVFVDCGNATHDLVDIVFYPGEVHLSDAVPGGKPRGPSEDRDAKIDMSPRYPRNQCMRFGQSRFGPVKRSALDGRVWWRIYDFKEHGCVPGYRFRKRRQALVQLVADLRGSRLPYEPDPGFGRDWLKSRPGEEIADLVDRKATFRAAEGGYDG